MGKTIAEKILSIKTGNDVKANDIVIAPVDGIMATDTTAPLSIKAFLSMGGSRVWNPSKCSFIIDHAAPAPNERIANLHQMMRDFASEQGFPLYDIGEGVCHQVIMEKRHIKPGDIFMGADSHTPTGGALNAFACGMGSTDLGAIMLTGKTWLKTPATIRVICNGILQKGVHAKDLVLYLTGKITISGATYLSVEFHGETFEAMGLSDRMCVANMLAEMGAKTGFIHPKGLKLDYDFNAVFPDVTASYVKTFEFDVSDLNPQIAAPESPDNVMNIDPHLRTKINYAFIGTCGNGRLEDLHVAAAILKGKKIKSGVRFIIAPASRKVLLEAMLDGTAYTLVEAGATIINPGCGPCVGTHEGVPGNGETVISAANRNFKGRMGNPHSDIYLAAPATVAASALTGEITNPAQLL
ncbi:MAG: 3-isopropylmalate dehydratase large subunit [Saprospiraceae bacterium]|jgi:3-isopropylmalate/(R)-2-methylmalate dehydratase large subunit|nr:3-isopropylmalate dehydratase large subunit [Saprospiraceae bacterium]